MKLRHDIIKQLLKDGIISINYVKSELNSADSLTKPRGEKINSSNLKRDGVKANMIVNRDGNPTYVIGDPMK